MDSFFLIMERLRLTNCGLICPHSMSQSRPGQLCCDKASANALANPSNMVVPFSPTDDGKLRHMQYRAKRNLLMFEVIIGWLNSIFSF